MFDKLYAWIGKNTINIVVALVFASAGFTIYNLVDVVRKPTPIQVVEGSIQHHLVWDSKGSCYFVLPYNNDVSYLIPIAECSRNK